MGRKISAPTVAFLALFFFFFPDYLLLTSCHTAESVKIRYRPRLNCRVFEVEGDEPDDRAGFYFTEYGDGTSDGDENDEIFPDEITSICGRPRANAAGYDATSEPKTDEPPIEETTPYDDSVADLEDGSYFRRSLPDLPAIKMSRKNRAISPLAGNDAEANDDGFNRVLGGSESRIEHQPWQVSIRQHGSHICGGVLLSNRFVVTAAHCFAENPNPGYHSVMLGKSEKLRGEDNEVWRRIKIIIIHSHYNNETKENDIALLYLLKPVTFSERILPACLPSRSQQSFDYSDLKCNISGYGDTRGTSGEGMLKAAEVLLFDQDECRRLNTDFELTLTDKMICAGWLNGSADSCQGDSGGPLFCRSKADGDQGRHILYGVVSFGWDCGAINSPGVYTRVTSYLDWLAANVKAHDTDAQEHGSP